MTDTHRPHVLVWATIAMITVTVFSAFHPATAAIRHDCGRIRHLEQIHASSDAHGHLALAGCCADIQCCPTLPPPAQGFATSHVELVPLVRVDVEDPLILDENIDPPPRLGNV